MNNKTQIIQEAKAIKNPTFELKKLLNKYDEKLEKGDKNVRKLLNQIKNRTQKILHPKKEYE